MHIEAKDIQKDKSYEQIEHVDLYIDGEFRKAQSGKVFVNMNPFTNKEINRVAEGDRVDINLAVLCGEIRF